MARDRSKVGSLTYQVKSTLSDKLRIGESKHIDKELGTAQQGIYSWSTFNSYMKHCNYFVAYCKEQFSCRTLAECRPYADQWLQKQMDKGLSAYTLKLEVSALSKLYGCKSTDFIATPSRHRSEITRSRLDVARDKNFSVAKNDRFVRFCQSTGLRRDELRRLTGDQLERRGDQYYIRVTGKGGRERLAPVVGDVRNVVDQMKDAGSGKVFSHINSNVDIHGYRSQYAVAVYQNHARDIKTLQRSEIYYCRGDLKGVKYDRAAMLIASQALGHNRVSVIAGHYLR